tara:strand:+ start:649 stop:981 length:333 start_codon:yes stop_codon:yes gene_type:complete
MSVYKILDGAGGSIVNTIVAEEDFVSAHHDHYEVVNDELTSEQLAHAKEAQEKMWRNHELETTDKAANTLDWPNRDNILTYRAALRDWPAKNEAGEYTNGFPETKPVLAE